MIGPIGAGLKVLSARPLRESFAIVAIRSERTRFAAPMTLSRSNRDTSLSPGKVWEMLAQLTTPGYDFAFLIEMKTVVRQ